MLAGSKEPFLVSLLAPELLASRPALESCLGFANLVRLGWIHFRWLVRICFRFFGCFAGLRLGFFYFGFGWLVRLKLRRIVWEGRWGICRWSQRWGWIRSSILQCLNCLQLFNRFRNLFQNSRRDLRFVQSSCYQQETVNGNRFFFSFFDSCIDVSAR